MNVGKITRRVDVRDPDAGRGKACKAEVELVDQTGDVRRRTVAFDGSAVGSGIVGEAQDVGTDEEGLQLGREEGRDKGDFFERHDIRGLDPKRMELREDTLWNGFVGEENVVSREVGRRNEGNPRNDANLSIRSVGEDYNRRSRGSEKRNSSSEGRSVGKEFVEEVKSSDHAVGEGVGRRGGLRGVEDRLEDSSCDGNVEENGLNLAGKLASVRARKVSCGTDRSDPIAGRGGRLLGNAEVNGMFGEHGGKVGFSAAGRRAQSRRLTLDVERRRGEGRDEVEAVLGREGVRGKFELDRGDIVDVGTRRGREEEAVDRTHELGFSGVVRGCRSRSERNEGEAQGKTRDSRKET